MTAEQIVTYLKQVRTYRAEQRQFATDKQVSSVKKEDRDYWNEVRLHYDGQVQVLNDVLNGIEYEMDWESKKS